MSMKKYQVPAIHVMELKKKGIIAFYIVPGGSADPDKPVMSNGKKWEDDFHPEDPNEWWHGSGGQRPGDVS